MAARTTKTDEQKAEEAKAAEQAAAEQAAAEQKAADEAKAAEDAKVTSDDDGSAEGREPTSDESDAKSTIPAVEHSAPAVENADAIAEEASPKDVTEEDGVAAFRPPQTQHTPWTLNTLAESEGGSALGVTQTSGNADVTLNQADRDAEAK